MEIMKEISPQLQNQIIQLRQLQQQAQALAIQRGQIEIMLREAEAALGEMEKAGAEEVIYRAVGEILIKSKKEDIQTALAEKKETYSLRLKTLEKQEERILKRVQELQTQIQSALEAGTSGAG